MSQNIRISTKIKQINTHSQIYIHPKFMDIDCYKAHGIDRDRNVDLGSGNVCKGSILTDILDLYDNIIYKLFDDDCNIQTNQKMESIPCYEYERLIIQKSNSMISHAFSMEEMSNGNFFRWMSLILVQYCHFSDSPDAIMKRYISNLNRYISFQCIEVSSINKSSLLDNQSIIIAVKLLAIAWMANEKMKCVQIGTFANDTLSSILNIKEDFPRWKSKKKEFSFCRFPFILSICFKCDLLKVESLVQMRHELQDAFFRSMFGGIQIPYLIIEIRREHIIRDTMIQLDRIRKQDLRKQLRIQFVGEEGIDEGGLQKEFFQLAVREILDPKYGMFLLNEDNNCYWFHPSQYSYNQYSNSQDSDPILLHEYKLIGKLIGLAIYNNVILDLGFPVVLFKKLLGQKVVFEDLQQIDPLLYKGLIQLLSINEDDTNVTIEDLYQRTFTIEQNHFGEIIMEELVPNGHCISLTKDNREEYVSCIVEYYLDRSISRAMQALYQGFHEICIDTSINLFQPEEFEVLVCGHSNLDMNGLRIHTCYDGGYNAYTLIIQYFWDIVINEMNTQDKKKLLFFTTGSDRMPVGGPSKLEFVITRQGPDSELLPTAHTCFNVLLLSEYATKDKLRSKLFAAIQNAEGFGLM